MAKVCQLTGKKPATGNNRSHSMRATKRRFLPNTSKKTIVDPVTGKKVKVRISTRAQRTLLKNPGKFSAELKKLVKKSEKRNAKSQQA
ncbi:MAG: 50S ribosomal protein L28 [Candidatus Gracilibacteria bacterium]|nr:50S ribosomal protein L28 [Candidatus Peregrinibacteria bacterium]